MSNRFAIRKLLSWTPAEISANAWYDAADIDTITIGTGVSQWDDKSGNGNHVTQGIGGEQPDYIASDPMFGGMPSVYTLQNATKHLDQSATTVCKRVYFVCYYGDGTEVTWGNHNAIFAATDGSVRLTGRANDHRVWDGLRATQNFDYRATTGATTYRNGSTVNTNYEANGLPIPANMFRIESPLTHTEVWRLLNNGASFSTFGGGLGELIMTDGSEDFATEQKVEGYLAWKWGIEGLLPSVHPYKNGKPLI